MEIFKKHDEVDIVSMPIHYFGAKHGEHPLNYKFQRTQVINLLENPEYPQLSGASSFFRLSGLKDYKFDEFLKVSEDPLLINQMLLDNPKIGFIDGSAYYYRKHDNSKSLISSSSNRKSFYTSRIDNYFLKIIDCSLKKYDEVPKFIQHVLMYDLQWVFEIKNVTHLLARDEFVELYAKLIKILSFIDNDVIIFQKSIPGTLKSHIMLLKKHGVRYLGDKTDIGGDGCNHIRELDLDKINIDICQIEGDELYILGYFTTFTIEPNIKVKVNDSKVIPVKLISFPQRDNYSLNFNYGFNHNFEVSIPIEDNTKITFEIDQYPLIPEYERSSRLSKISHYILSERYLVIDNDDSITVLNRTFADTLKNELKTLKNMLLHRGGRVGELVYFLDYCILLFIHFTSIKEFGFLWICLIVLMIMHSSYSSMLWRQTIRTLKSTLPFQGMTMR